MLEQEGEGAAAKWKIKYHKEVTEDSPKTITGEAEFEKYFPSAKVGGFVKDGDNTHWDFLKDKTELASMCGGENSCGMALSPLKPFKRRWDWAVVSPSAENNKLIGWVKDFQW